MKILLIHPVYKDYKISEPLGLCYIAAYARQRGFAVDILDPRIHDHDLQEMLNHLHASVQSYGLIGISCCDNYYQEIKDTIAGLRGLGFSGQIVLGGYGPTTHWEMFVTFGADAIILGEGEETFYEIAKSIENQSCWRHIDGIAYWDTQGEKVRNTPRALIKNMDTLPFPSRDLYRLLRAKYGASFISPQIQGSRGCYMQCTFCSTPAFLSEQGGERYRLRSIKSIVDEIEQLYWKEGVCDFEFVDDNFLPPAADQKLLRAKEFYEEVKKRKLAITFFMQFRPEYVSIKILDYLKKAGMTRFFIGIESIHDKDLQLYGRAYTKNEVVQCIKIILKAGYSTRLTAPYRFKFGYINFNPLTTLEELRQSGRFFKRFGFTYKKLSKTLLLYDRQRRVYQKILAVFPQYTEENPFLDEKVFLYYQGISRYFDVYKKERDQYRVLEKALKRKKQKRAILYSYFLKIYRWRLDRRAFCCYMKGIDVAEIMSMPKELEHFFQKQTEIILHIVNKKQRLLNKLYNKMGIEAKKNDLFF